MPPMHTSLELGMVLCKALPVLSDGSGHAQVSGDRRR